MDISPLFGADYARCVAKLSARERAQLPDSAFAYVNSEGKRSLPINDEAHALLFASAFFVLSPAWAYVFWLQPEILNMASVAVAFGAGKRRNRDRRGRFRQRRPIAAS